jgi:hypothetical protein
MGKAFLERFDGLLALAEAIDGLAREALDFTHEAARWWGDLL